jgi:hypothetical protein
MKSIIVLLLLSLLIQCKPQTMGNIPYPIYIYDSIQNFMKYNIINDTLNYLVFRTYKPIYKYFDTFLVAKEYKYYSLEHYLKYNDYRDTFFVKKKAYIDSIKYFNNKWLNNEEKLDSLWQPIDCWRCGGICDTSKIFLILQIDHTDSVIFRQVHRRYFQTN